ncbi:AAA family ATPase, partial [bacterium]|nr:AAA family ATPase [bacterium]
MLPQKLIIEGLYSYQKRQEIDFTVLNDAGLFGIFGIVGSGKSAILEAISLALYGETERLGQKDRNYSLMNLKSNLLYLEFEFIAGKNQEKLYKFTVKSKRNSKNFAEVRSLDRNAYLKQGNEWIPLKDKTAETIIGLSYDNFKRTVIIPQGKFQEFLQLKPTERTKMLKEIFYLSKYDLFDRCSGLIKENAGNLSENQGGLKALAQNLTPETLVNKEKELKEFLIKIEVQEKPLKVMEQKEKTFATLKENTDNANILKQEIKILENEKEKFKQKEKSLTDYEICKQNFQDVLVQENNLQLKKRNLNQELKTKTESFIKKQHFLTKQQEDHKKTKAIYQKKDVLEKKITEIPLLKNIMIKQQELIKKEQKLLQVNKEVNSLKEKLDLQTVQIKEQTTLLKNKKNKQLDPEKLIKVQNLFAEQKNLTVRIKENQEKSTEFSKEITKTEIQLGNILGQKIDFNKNQAMVLKKINLLIRQKETNLKNDKKQLEEWALQEKLSEFTTKIK